MKGPIALIGGGVVILVAVVIVLVLGGGSSGSGPDAGAGPTGPDGSGPRTSPLESIFEADVELEANPTGTLALMKKLGVQRMRVFVPWGALGSRPPIAPDPLATAKPSFDATDPAAYPATGWAVYDAIDRAATADGIGLDFTLGPPAPNWAVQQGEPRNPGGAPGPAGVWKVSAADFGQFVRAAGKRYDGSYPDPLHPGRTLPRVRFWAIWNEPNLGINLAPQAVKRGSLEVSPRFYRRMVDAAWSALQATGHGSDTIVFGELAPDGSTVPPEPGNFDMMPPLRFLRALYCVDASYHPLSGAAASARGCPATSAASSRFRADHPGLFRATGLADHPYTQGQAPNVLTPNEPDYADFPALGRLETALDRVFAAHGSHTQLPIFSTEFGYRTNPPEKLARADPPAVAAQYLNWSEYRSWHDPRIRSYDQYLLRDSPTGQFANGLVNADGSEKPTYGAYRMPVFLPVTSTSKGGALEVWGCARPLDHLHGGARKPVAIQFSSGAAFRTVGTVTVPGSGCYFDVRQAFPGSGSVRLRWSYPDGTAVLSRTVAVTVR